MTSISLSGFNNLGISSSLTAYTITPPTSNLATTYGSTWSKLGTTINGINSNDAMSSIAISKNGDTFVAGAVQTQNTGLSGYAIVYRNISGTWTMLGSAIYGLAAGDQFGISVSISADGNTIAVGSIDNNGFFSNGPGYVRVFTYSTANNTWTQLGGVIRGTTEGAMFGVSVCLSANGRRVIIGEQQKNYEATPGLARVFDYNVNKVAEVTDTSSDTYGPVGWTRIGSDFTGIPYALYGRNVSMSDDGRTVAISAPLANTGGFFPTGGGSGGITRVFRYDVTKTTAVTDDTSDTFGPKLWTRIGGDFYGSQSTQSGGFWGGVKLSSDGTKVLIAYAGENNVGFIRVFQYDINKTTTVTDKSSSTFGPKYWYQLGQSVTGSTAEDTAGYSASISNDGTIIAFTAGYGDSNPPSNNNNVGYIKAFRYTSSTNTWSQLGQTLTGTVNFGIFGAYIGLSANGSKLSVVNQVPSLAEVYSIDVSGGFTYASSNTSVVEPYDTTLIVKSLGSSVITATQSGYGAYATTSINATATVQSFSYTLVLSNFSVPSKTYGDIPFTLTAPTSNNTPASFIYSSSNLSVATVSGNTVTLIGSGTATISAYQAASNGYSDGTITATLTVARGVSTFASSTFAVASSKVVGDVFAITTRPTSNSDGAITYSSSNTAVATIDASGNFITAIGVGDVSFNAAQAQTSQYLSATKTSNTLTVSKGTPSYQSISQVSKTYGVDASFSLYEIMVGKSTSSGAYTFSSSSTAISISGDFANILQYTPSAATINVSQAATANYNVGTTSFTLLVARGTSTLSSSTFTVASSKTIIDASFAITTRPTSNSTGVITYSSSNTSVATIDASGNFITIVGLGDVSFNAAQAETNQYSNAIKTSNTLTVTKATPTLAFVSPPTTKNVTDAAFTVTASSASLGTVVYSSSNTSFATVDATTGLVTLKGAGTVTITASQTSTATYESSNATCSIVINSAGTTLQGQTITSGTSYASVDLSGASLVGTTVSGVSFSGANLSNVNFSGAIITGTNFTNANINGAINLPAFSTTQKLQLLSNINNVTIGSIQINTPLSGADINASLPIPITALDSAIFTLKVPTTLDASLNKIVTITTIDISNNKSVYIPLNANETVKINGTVFSFNGTNLFDISNNIRTYLTVEGTPFKIYAGSVIALNMSDSLNKLTFSNSLTNIYTIVSQLFVSK